ncbi:MAG TPA: YezD family protein [Pseudogracilibacillus sp.]|nr:YezD family protein [Pseudogracilibacillus sp.]
MKEKVESNVHLPKIILDMLESIAYGTITIVIQDGKVIQVEKNEKIRLR